MKISWNPVARKIVVYGGRNNHKILDSLPLSGGQHWRRCSRYVVIVTGKNPSVYDFKRGTNRTIESTDKKWGRFAIT